tara:strand:- start:42963 stop:43073 length:111 start_codon:yes stop_codon:yes gene_type:complete
VYPYKNEDILAKMNRMALKKVEVGKKPVYQEQEFVV